MNCEIDCYKFFRNKTQENLGNIHEENSCANCLYWKNGPGRDLYQYTRCQCHPKIKKLTNDGNKMSVNDYYDIVNCLDKANHEHRIKNDWEEYKKCGVLYSNFTNTTYYNPNSKGVYFKKFNRECVK